MTSLNRPARLAEPNRQFEWGIDVLNESRVEPEKRRRIRRNNWSTLEAIRDVTVGQKELGIECQVTNRGKEWFDASQSAVPPIFGLHAYANRSEQRGFSSVLPKLAPIGSWHRLLYSLIPEKTQVPEKTQELAQLIDALPSGEYSAVRFRLRELYELNNSMSMVSLRNAISLIGSRRWARQPGIGLSESGELEVKWRDSSRRILVILIFFGDGRAWYRVTNRAVGETDFGSESLDEVRRITESYLRRCAVP